MINYQAVITEDVDTLLCEERKHARAKLRDRVRILRLLKSGEARSLAAAAHILGLSTQQVRKLFLRYRKEGMKGLLQWRYKGNHRKISCDDESKFVAEVAKRQQGFASQKQAQAYIADTFGVQLTQPAISFLFSRNGIRLKTARPRNIETSEEKQQEYKKNLLPM